MARLGQLIKKLEIGTDTAVDFLKSNGCEIENNLNAKLDARQEELLINKFASEEVKAELVGKKQKKESNASANTADSKGVVKQHTLNVLGKIDLDALNKPASKKTVAPVANDLNDDKHDASANSAAENTKPTVVPEEEKPVEKPVVKPVEKPVEETVVVNSDLNPSVKEDSKSEKVSDPILESKPEVKTISNSEERKDPEPEMKNNNETKIEHTDTVTDKSSAASSAPVAVDSKPMINNEESKNADDNVSPKKMNTTDSENSLKKHDDSTDNDGGKEIGKTVKSHDAGKENNNEKEPENVHSEPVADKKQNEDEIFKTDSHLNAISLPKVVGKIDLDKINTNTRPVKSDKKSQDDSRFDKGKNKKKDRQNKVKAEGGEKANKQNAAEQKPNAPLDSSAANPKKDKKQKRRRINEQPVDVEAVIKGQNNQNNQNKQNAQNNANSQNDQNSKKDFKNSKSKGKGDNFYNESRDGKNSKKNKQKYSHSYSPTEEEVNDRIQKTYAELQDRNKSTKKGAQYRKEKREAIAQRQMNEAAQEVAQSKVLKLTEFVTVNELATMMNKPVNEVIQTCFNAGLFVAINQRLDAEVINLVAEEFGFTTEFVSADVVNAIHEEQDKEEDLVPRPPIVTVMGHVDHGKTSLLDYIRKSNVIAGEAGGITQHIGAYNVQLDDGRRITFLDTPGHEAFTAMRARGAKVTDIVIIIVAADDDVMPQTVEAINHASAAGVPIVFAINKIDKPAANPDKVKESLAAMNYLVEDWGGKYQSQDISAKSGIGVEELLEKVLIEAELLDLKANPNRRATGSVIESSLDKGRGYVATVLVSNGTLRIGDVMLAGTNYGRVKAMFNERNQRVKEAGPSEPVIVLGLNGAPQAGDNFNIFAEDHEAREIAAKREQLAREQGIRTSKHTTLDEIGRRIALGNFQELNIIVKGDVDGSIEALSDSFLKLSTEEIQVNVIHKAVGQISESDVMLATASNAIIVGFQVRPSLAARKLAEKEGIEIRLYSIIYDAIEELKSAMEGMLAPDIKEEVTATLEIRETFKISKVGTIAGCKVTEGKIKRTNKIRLIRDGIVIYTGELASLKRMKDDVKEVASGYECGLNIANYNDIKIGDIIEAFEEVEVKKSL